MRLPNGYGSVTKLSGNRRRPYMVRKTDGFDERGYPIYRIIGYTATREEGLALLAEYNNAPWDVNIRDITLGEMFERWKKLKANKLGEGNRKALISAYRHCQALENMPYRLIRAHQMQEAIDNCGHGPSTQAKIKSLWVHLDKLALEIDLPVKGYSSLLTADPVQSSTSREPFTEAEISAIWADQDAPWADSVLILLYSGWRIKELLQMRKEDVDLQERLMRGGSKTAAGRNRIVPIHPRILPLVEARMRQPGEYLLSLGGKQCPETPYRKRWAMLMQKWGMHHIPHECRHTFRSRLDSAGANQRCCDLLMGHVSKDTGNRVYNHKTIEELREAILLLP